MNRRDYIRSIGAFSTGMAGSALLAGCRQQQMVPDEPGLPPLDRDWAIGPFVKHDTPILTPNPESTFYCPINDREIRWEEQNVYNPAAVVKNSKIYLLYRADGLEMVDHEVWQRTCRQGLAFSDDGVHFTRHPKPVLYPDNDPYKQYEWLGGVEDIHIIEDNGTYYANYTAWNGMTDATIVATSTDLYNWSKHGPAFGDLTDGSSIRDRTGVVVSRLVGDKLLATRVNGLYWMYYNIDCSVATSDDLIHWTPLFDADGKPVRALAPRDGYFDSGSCEAGAAALLTDRGILLLYNAFNNTAEEGGDPAIPPTWSSVGQALLDRNDPTRLLDRLDKPFLHAELEWEMEGYLPNALVSNALVLFNGQWHLYYGAADRRIGLARAKA